MSNTTNNNLINAIATDVVDRYKDADTAGDIIFFAADAMETLEAIAKPLEEYGVTALALRDAVTLKTTLALERKQGMRR